MIRHSVYFQRSAMEIVYETAKKRMQFRTQFFGDQR